MMFCESWRTIPEFKNFSSEHGYQGKQKHLSFRSRHFDRSYRFKSGFSALYSKKRRESKSMSSNDKQVGAATQLKDEVAPENERSKGDLKSENSQKRSATELNSELKHKHLKTDHKEENNGDAEKYEDDGDEDDAVPDDYDEEEGEGEDGPDEEEDDDEEDA